MFLNRLRCLSFESCVQPTGFDNAHLRYNSIRVKDRETLSVLRKLEIMIFPNLNFRLNFSESVLKTLCKSQLIVSNGK